MTPDRNDLTPEAHENGVLADAAGIDTAHIGILGGATAQLDVTIPAARDDEDYAVDESVDDDIDHVDIAALHLADARLRDGDATVAESVDEADADIPMGEIDDSDEEIVETDEREDADAAGQDASGHDAADPRDHVPAHVDDAGEAEVAAAEPMEESAMSSENDSAAPGAADEAPAHTEESAAAAVNPSGAAPLAQHRQHTPRSHHAAEVALAPRRLGEFESGRESADLLTADRLLDEHAKTKPEPEGAWQHFVYSISGKRINLGDGKRARARKELDKRIAGALGGRAKFVPVLSRKGGVGKTTITTLLGMALADARNDRVIAVDANPDRGTLAERISTSSGKTVRDLARGRDDVIGYNDISTIVARDETRLDVLASDADPHVSEEFSDRDYHDVAALAAHYYSIVLTDTGTGIVHSVMEATLDLSDALVIVAGMSIDEARLASETLTWLESNGYAEQVRSAVVVLNTARPGAPLVRADELEAHFRTRVRAVVRMPYDPHIATGSAITFRELQPATREAARELAATVVEGLRSLAPVA